MSIAHVKVPGLDESRLVALIDPVLVAHGVVGVELLWKTDGAGWVLTVNVENPDAKLPGEGITLEVCTQLSHDLSTALDVDDLIAHPYRLEVGSPGIERHLYQIEDYRRFAGQAVKGKLRNPVEDVRAFRGRLIGTTKSDSREGTEAVPTSDPTATSSSATERVVFEVEGKTIEVPHEEIASCRLVYTWDSPSGSGEAKAKSPKPRSPDRSRGNRASKRKR
ncbi:MAG: ribosome maturation factor RimP [Polyangiaceae bacterium]